MISGIEAIGVVEGREPIDGIEAIDAIDEGGNTSWRVVVLDDIERCVGWWMELDED